MTKESAAEDRLQEAAAGWSRGMTTAWEVVQVACDALVAGVDSPALCELAAVSRGDADYCVPSLLEAALGDLGLEYYPWGSQRADEAVARSLAAQLLRGELGERQLAARIHELFSHHLPLAARLAELDDEYDVIEYTGSTAAEINAEVRAEARRMLAATDRRSSDGGPEGCEGEGSGPGRMERA